MSARYFEDLEVWILSRELTNKIYSVSSDGRFAKDFGLRDQIRRAADTKGQNTRSHSKGV
ncbi:MAG: hypothetical protein SCARUB_03344 [Candidatus Scalindua rubra]|uniref:Four helix bundle protein n=1 Tax=Candidatus Scalindua rubra TaxID=1872076 RepID=A0A1E3X7C6_9BACT|nr:MAG: hypothetical protein SCARUB_03344 [Candidatus Scalindua rubra]